MPSAHRCKSTITGSFVQKNGDIRFRRSVRGATIALMTARFKDLVLGANDHHRLTDW